MSEPIRLEETAARDSRCLCFTDRWWNCPIHRPETNLPKTESVDPVELARLRQNSERLEWCLKHAFGRDQIGLCFRRNYRNIEEFMSAVDAELAAEKGK